MDLCLLTAVLLAQGAPIVLIVLIVAIVAIVPIAPNASLAVVADP